MGHFLDVAYKALSEAKEPLTPKQIVKIAIENQWLVTEGLTPKESMRARLSTDILHNKEKSLFIRTASGKFGLRLWDEHTEYIADRYVRALLKEDILIFPRRSFKKYVSGTGLLTIPIENRSALIHELGSMERNLAEEDQSVIQFVSSFIVRYENKYLTYMRSKRLPESRLHNYYSIPFGGHLNPDDNLPLFDIFDPKVAESVLVRELREELRFNKNRMPRIKFKGLLYDTSTLMGRQHLGVLYDVYLESPEFTIGERGFLMNAKFETLDEIEARINEFENWSRIIVDFEKNNNNRLYEDVL